jgi:small-conductance mechanosensitive channel
VVRRHRDRIDRAGTVVINALGVSVWLWATLRLVRLWSPVVDWMKATLATSLTFGSVTIEAGGVLAFIAVLVITTFVSRILRVLLEEDVLSRTKLPHGLPGTISTVAHYAIITLGFLLAMAAAGIELNRLVVLAGALGVGIGFGLQDIVRNFVSGLILAFERPFGIGDVIEVGTLMGKVRRIGARSSTIRTFDGADVIVPNSNLVSDQVINWTLTDSNRRLTISVGVAYESDPERVLEVLREVADGHPEVSRYPEPMTLFRGFGDSALEFELRFWISDVEWTLRTASAMTNAVHDALKVAGITIPFPQRDLHLRTVAADGQVMESLPEAAGPNISLKVPIAE